MSAPAHSSTVSAAGQSLWGLRNAADPAYTQLHGEVDADLAIVGGGLAGVSLAYHLANRGMSTVVLEAREIGSGASSKAAGVVAPQLSRHTPESVCRTLGADQGRRYLRMLASSGQYLFDLVQRCGIQGSAVQSGFLSPVRGARSRAQLEELLRQWLPLRGDLELLDAAGTEQLSGCRGYEAAVLDRSGGVVDPLALTQGLARAAAAAGARIYEQSPVIELVQTRDCWQVNTDTGRVRAGQVVLCAHSGNEKLDKRLRHSTLPLQVFQVATEPLDASVTAAILPLGHALTDQEADVFSLRHDLQGRLITAYPAPAGTAQEVIQSEVNRRLAAIAGLPRVRLEHIWHGTALVNTNLLARIVRLDEGLLAVQACNGRGIAINTILGHELAGWLSDRQRKPIGIPIEAPRRVRGFALAKFLPGLMVKAGLIRRRWRANPPTR